MILSFFISVACVLWRKRFSFNQDELARQSDYSIRHSDLGKNDGTNSGWHIICFSTGQSLLSYLWVTAVTYESCQSSTKTSSNSRICSQRREETERDSEMRLHCSAAETNGFTNLQFLLLFVPFPQNGLEIEALYFQMQHTLSLPFKKRMP